MELPRILIVDDDEMFISSIKLGYSASYSIEGVSSGKEALAAIDRYNFAAMILDIGLGGEENGIDLISRIKQKDSTVPIIMLTASTDYKDAIRSFKLGASEYLAKSLDLEELDIILKRAVREYELNRKVICLREELSYHTQFEEFVFCDKKMESIMGRVESLAKNDSTVLISGETGTGKEVVARTIHKLSERREGPFIAVNCSGITESLFESEMFGYKRGAFTGAVNDYCGKFSLANKGTLFLDEISSMPRSSQASLLRVIEEKQICPLGDPVSKHIDVRIISATNKDLQHLIEEEEFRKDLYFRLNVIPIHIPPLRERLKDIPPLINHFLMKYYMKANNNVLRLHPEIVDIFLQHSWPGNVRELQNVIERLVVLHKDGDTIMTDELPLEFLMKSEEVQSEQMDQFSLIKAKEELEKDLIEVILRRVGWRKAAAAKILGIHRNWLTKQCKKYGIEEKRADSAF